MGTIQGATDANDACIASGTSLLVCMPILGTPRIHKGRPRGILLSSSNLSLISSLIFFIRHDTGQETGLIHPAANESLHPPEHGTPLATGTLKDLISSLISSLIFFIRHDTGQETGLSHPAANKSLHPPELKFS